jgi:hypothetical protein
LKEDQRFYYSDNVYLTTLILTSIQLTFCMIPVALLYSILLRYHCMVAPVKISVYAGVH